MSTTKVFIIFGVFVIIVTFPLIVMDIWFHTMLGRYVGLVENIIAGMIGAFIVALALDFSLRTRQEKAAEKVAKIGLSQASQVINRMLSLLAGMIKVSSNGFIPSTIEELFGAEAQELISLHLALGKRALTTSNILWQDYIAGEVEIVEDGLTSVHERYQAFLNENALVAIGILQASSLLDIFRILPAAVRSSIELGVQKPVLNMPLRA